MIEKKEEEKEILHIKKLEIKTKQRDKKTPSHPISMLS